MYASSISEPGFWIIRRREDVPFIYERRGFEPDVVPNSPQAGYLQAEIRKAFKSYLSKHPPSTVI